MAKALTVTGFSIRKDQLEVEKPSGTAAQAGKAWKAYADAAPAGVKVELYVLYSDGSEDQLGWSRKPLPSEWESPEAWAYFQKTP